VRAGTLNCYRLAKYYGCHPSQFLSLTFTEIERHMAWTDHLLAILEEERDA
jgi:hypothetical protein